MYETFGIIAEFSIGLAGFSGVVALIGNVPIEFVWFRIRSLLITAFAPGFISLVGILHLHIETDVVAVVRTASALLGAMLLFGLIVGIRSLRGLDSSAKALLNRALLWFNLTTYPANIVIQFFNTAVPTKYAEGILVGGLVILLLSAAITFSAIIGMMVRQRSNAT